MAKPLEPTSDKKELSKALFGPQVGRHGRQQLSGLLGAMVSSLKGFAEEMQTVATLRDRMVKAKDSDQAVADMHQLIGAISRVQVGADSGLHHIFQNISIKEPSLEERNNGAVIDRCTQAKVFLSKLFTSKLREASSSDLKLSLKHFLFQCLVAIRVEKIALLAEDFVEIQDPKEIKPFLDAKGITIDQLQKKTTKENAFILYRLLTTMPDLLDISVESILAISANKDLSFIESLGAIGLLTFSEENITLRGAITHKLFSAIAEEGKVPEDKLSRAVTLWYRFRKSLPIAQEAWDEFFSCPLMQTEAPHWQNILAKMEKNHLGEVRLQQFGAIQNFALPPISANVLQTEWRLWQVQLDQSVKVILDACSMLKQQLMDSTLQTMKGNQKSQKKQVENNVRSSPIYQVVVDLEREASALIKIHKYRSLPMNKLMGALQNQPENASFALLQFQSYLKWIHKSCDDLVEKYSTIQEIVEEIDDHSTLGDLKKRTIETLTEMVDSTHTMGEEYSRRFAVYIDALSPTYAVEVSDAIDESLFVEESSSSVEVEGEVESEEEQEVVVIDAPSAASSSSQPAVQIVPDISELETEACLKEIEARLISLKGGAPTSLIDSFSHYMTAIAPALRKKFFQEGADLFANNDLKKSYRAAVNEVLSHLFLMMQGLELIASVVEEQRFDLLEPCIQAFLVDSHVAVEQRLALAVAAKDGAFPHQHALSLLGQHSGLEFLPKEQEFIDKNHSGLLWARYVETYKESFERGGKPLPPALSCLVSLSQGATKDKISLVLREVMENCKASLSIVLGKDNLQIFPYIDHLHDCLEHSLKRAVMPKKEDLAPEEMFLQETRMRLEKTLLAVPLDRKAGEGDPTLSLREVACYLRWMQLGHQLQRVYGQPSLDYWHLRSELNVDKLFKHLLTALCLLHNLGDVRWHTLSYYVNTLEGVGMQFSANEKVLMKEINVGIGHHYVHIKRSVWGSVCRKFLMQSKNESRTPAGFVYVGQEKGPKRERKKAPLIAEALGLFSMKMLPATLERLGIVAKAQVQAKKNPKGQKV